MNDDIINCGYATNEVLYAIEIAASHQRSEITPHFGDGKSDKLFLEVCTRPEFW